MINFVLGSYNMVIVAKFMLTVSHNGNPVISNIQR